LGKAYIVASDLGTGGCKTVALDQNANLIASDNAEYPTHNPHPGWSEQNPEDWISALTKTTRSVLSQFDCAPGDIKGFGIVGVTHNSVLLDKLGKPLRPCILTYDSRSVGECKDLLDRWGDQIYRKTRNTMHSLWSWPQLEWIKKNEPDVWRNMTKILFQKDYVRNVIAPSPITDHIDAEGTLLFDPVKNQWIEEFVTHLGLEDGVLPETVAATEVVSKISPEGARLTGLPEGTKVIAGASDTVAEVLGAGALHPGQGTVKLASIGRITCVTRAPSDVPYLLNYRHVLDDLWYPGTASKYATSSFRWLKDIMWPESTYEEMSEAACLVPPGCDGMLFLPHLEGEWAPIWDDKYRAGFIGATVRHKRPHFTRAVMEGVAFAIRAGVEYMRDNGIRFDQIRLIGRGSTSDLWAQIMTDVLNRQIHIPSGTDAAFGSALLTGMGVGLYPAESEYLSEFIKVREIKKPRKHTASLYDDLYEIYTEADRRLGGIWPQLSEISKRSRVDK